MKNRISLLTLPASSIVVFILIIGRYALSGGSPSHRLGFGLFISVTPALATLLLLALARRSVSWQRTIAVYLVLLVATVVFQAYARTFPVRGAQAENALDDGSNLVGNWTGESICVDRNSACHDEKVVYRIPKAPDESGKVTITADKIVNGKPEEMGVLDFKYDAEKRTLFNEFTRGTTHGVWEFTVKGVVIEGTLSLLPERAIARRVKVKKDE